MFKSGKSILAVVLAGSVTYAVCTIAWNSLGDKIDDGFNPEVVITDLKNHKGQPIFAQRYEVTVAEWNMCFEAGVCDLQLSVRQKAREAEYPATGVSWIDVQQYLKWINGQSHKNYRLPTREEWMALAEDVLPEPATPLFDDPLLAWANSYSMAPASPRKLRPSGSFSATRSGIEDMDGSVWEWTSDCFDPAFSIDRCPAFHVGGEHVAAIPVFTRDPARGGCAVGTPPAHLGVRLVVSG